MNDKKFLHGMSDKEIKLFINEKLSAIESADNTNKVLRLAPLVQVGQTELQGRNTKRVTYLSFAISILSLAIAGSALYVSLESSKSAQAWENNQLTLLNEIKSESDMAVSKISKAIIESAKENALQIKSSSENIISVIKDVENKSANKTN